MTYCGRDFDPLPPTWAPSARRGLESQRGSCPPEALTELERCVQNLEEQALREDPDAAARRAEAQPRADALLADPSYQERLDTWSRSSDARTLACRTRDRSDADRRECERWTTEHEQVETRLWEFLREQGFDDRDIQELGLWPRG